jgi:hypothetical protein
MLEAAQAAEVRLCAEQAQSGIHCALKGARNIIARFADLVEHLQGEAFSRERLIAAFLRG